MLADAGYESASYTQEGKRNEIVYRYLESYNHAITDDCDSVLLLGGAGFNYPKYFISTYPDKKMDVVEIDEKKIELAFQYFYLDELYEEFDANHERLNIITDDARMYLANTEKKYDVIMNDTFSGNSPLRTMTTTEAILQVKRCLNEDGIYATNIISAYTGPDSMFLQSEMKTLSQMFKHVYAVPTQEECNLESVQNIMVFATDSDILFEGAIDVRYDDGIILTDDYCPVETLVPGRLQ